MLNSSEKIFCFGNAVLGRWPEAFYVRGQYAKSSSSRTADEHQAWRADWLRNLSRLLSIRKTV